MKITIETVNVRILMMESLLAVEKRHGRTNISPLTRVNMLRYCYQLLGRYN